MSRVVQSRVGPAGRRSHRTYTPEEVAAAKRLKVIHGHEQFDTLNGPMFWGTGDYWPKVLREVRADAERDIKAAELLLAAVEREWHKEGAATDGRADS